MLTYRQRPKCLLNISTVFISITMGWAVPTGFITATGRRPTLKHLSTYEERITNDPTTTNPRILYFIIGILSTAFLSILGVNVDNKTKGRNTRSEKSAPKNNIGKIVPLPNVPPPNMLQKFSNAVERKVRSNYTTEPPKPEVTGPPEHSSRTPHTN